VSSWINDLKTRLFDTKLNFIYATHVTSIFRKFANIRFQYTMEDFLLQFISINKVKCQLDATRRFYWCFLSSTCFGYICTLSGALDAELQHMVFCTEFLDGWWSWEALRRPCVRCGWCRAVARYHPHRKHDLRSGSQDHHPSKNSVKKTICCNSTSNAPDDGRIYLKHVELRIHQ